MRSICSTSWNNIYYLECAGEKSLSAPLAAGEPETLRRLKGLPSFIGAAVVVVISPCAATAIFSYTSAAFGKCLCDCVLALAWRARIYRWKPGVRVKLGKFI
jgi:hypothetical protein